MDFESSEVRLDAGGEGQAAMSTRSSSARWSLPTCSVRMLRKSGESSPIKMEKTPQKTALEKQMPYYFRLRVASDEAS